MCKAIKMISCLILTAALTGAAGTAAYADNVIISDMGPVGSSAGTETPMDAILKARGMVSQAVQEVGNMAAEAGFSQAEIDSGMEGVLNGAAGAAGMAAEALGNVSLPEADTGREAMQALQEAFGTLAQNASGTGGFVRDSLTLTPELESSYAILVNADTGMVVAGKREDERFNPASMTKVMTLLTAVGLIGDLNETVTITQDIIDYIEKEGASRAGFAAGETVSKADLLYGLILPSGADAALALCRTTVGSEQAFVDKMNEKAAELGIAGTTHFTNCTGLYGEAHYSTPADMARIMWAASRDPVATGVMNVRTYTTGASNKHSKGISLTNLFLKRIDSQETGGKVDYAKTGYVAKAGNCAVSYFTAQSGNHYICVTGKGQGAWSVVEQHAKLYADYAK